MYMDAVDMETRLRVTLGSSGFDGVKIAPQLTLLPFMPVYSICHADLKTGEFLKVREQSCMIPIRIETQL